MTSVQPPSPGWLPAAPDRIRVATNDDVRDATEGILDDLDAPNQERLGLHHQAALDRGPVGLPRDELGIRRRGGGRGRDAVRLGVRSSVGAMGGSRRAARACLDEFGVRFSAAARRPEVERLRKQVSPAPLTPAAR